MAHTARLTIDDLRGSASRRRKDRIVRFVLRCAAYFSMLVSALIVVVLLKGAITFLQDIKWDFGKLSDTGWFPRRSRFDLRTIITGSIVIGGIAMLIAVPFGLGTAIYLSEYASPRSRAIIKPIVEVLAGVPSVVVGYFAIRFIAPEIVSRFFNPTTLTNMTVAGIGIGILVIPIMASISEDALRSVPGSLREASYGIGARRSATTIRVVLPAAISGIVAAFIIATSRAIGETMVAAMASGFDGSGKFNVHPLDPGVTMTAAMTNASGGSDSVVAGAPYNVLFFVGLLLFLLTLGLNTVSSRFVRRLRQAY